MAFKFLAVIVGFALCIGTASAAPKVWVTARLVHVDQLGLVGSDMNVNGAFRLTFRITKVLLGRYSEKKVTTMGVQEARPVEGYSYFLLLEPSPKGAVVDWYSLEMYGLCFSNSEVSLYGIEKDLVELREEYPCP